MNTPTVNLIADASPSNAERQPFFPAELPVSFDTAGNVASRFGDLFWDLGSMSTDGTSSKKLHFYKAELSEEASRGWLIREQHKALMWLHMETKSSRSWNTLLNTDLAVGFCCKEADLRGLDLYSLLVNPDWIHEVATGLNKVYLSMLSSAIKTLWRSRKQLGWPSDTSPQRVLSILANEVKSRPGDQQTPLIPSRVYCSILAAISDRMCVIENELDTLLEAYACRKDASRRGARDQKQREAFRAKKLQETIKRMEKLGYKPTQAFSLSNFIVNRINQHKVTLMLVIAAYTGMRVGEIKVLPLDNVLVEFESLGCKHYEVIGSTHKLNNGVKLPTSWITSSEGARAIRLAQRIANTIREQHGKAPKAGQQALLFPSNDNSYKSLSSDSFLVAMKALRVDICPVVEPADLKELDELELARGWTRDDIVVGARWPLAFHQLRRSLAVYAHRSGMVSLPALKAQLQHIIQEMTLYYANGFSRAVNLVFDKTHFSHEWKAAKAESSFFAFALGVMFSDEVLLGQGAQRIANTLETRSRQDTLRLFKENKIAYRETTLGGCTSTGNLNHTGFGGG